MPTTVRLIGALIAVQLLYACNDRSPLSPTELVGRDSATLNVQPDSLTVGASRVITIPWAKNIGRRSVASTYSWRASAPSVARLLAHTSTSVTVTALSVGTTWIVRERGPLRDSVRLDVRNAAPIRIQPDSAALLVGQTFTFLLATPETVVWSSDVPQVASVSSTGRVNALAAGTVTVRAVAPDGRSGTARVVITSPAPPPTQGLPTTVRLPASIDTMVAASRSALAVRTLRPANGAGLQSALDSSRFGDEILLSPGTTYTGNFVLRRKTGTGWITVRTALADTDIPTAGVRARPSTANRFGRIQSSNSMLPAISTAAGTAGYRFLAVEITVAPSAATAYSLVSLGNGDGSQTGPNQPSRLVFDRVYVHGHPTLDFQRCFHVNSGATAIVDSWISDCHGRGYDSQAIFGYNGTGPYLIENNHLEGAGENVMFGGGGDPAVTGLVPSDITLRRNFVYKPATWQGVWSVKNSFELKSAKRVLVEGNVFDGSWVDGQVGFAIVLKTTNQFGTATWNETSDVTFRFNIIRNAACGMSLAGNPEGRPAVAMNKLYVGHNSFESNSLPGCGRVLEVSNVDTLTVEHNAGVSGAYGVSIHGNIKMKKFEMTNNIFGVTGPRYSVWDWALSSLDGGGFGTEALNYHVAAPYRVVGNLFVGVRIGLFPAGSASASADNTVFVNFPHDLRPSPNSLLIGAGAGGKTPGPDWTILGQRTAVVVVRP